MRGSRAWKQKRGSSSHEGEVVLAPKPASCERGATSRVHMKCSRRCVLRTHAGIWTDAMPIPVDFALARPEAVSSSRFSHSGRQLVAEPRPGPGSDGYLISSVK